MDAHEGSMDPKTQHDDSDNVLPHDGETNDEQNVQEHVREEMVVDTADDVGEAELGVGVTGSLWNLSSTYKSASANVFCPSCSSRETSIPDTFSQCTGGACSAQETSVPDAFSQYTGGANGVLVDVVDGVLVDVVDSIYLASRFISF